MWPGVNWVIAYEWTPGHMLLKGPGKASPLFFVLCLDKPGGGLVTNPHDWECEPAWAMSYHSKLYSTEYDDKCSAC